MVPLMLPKRILSDRLHASAAGQTHDMRCINAGNLRLSTDVDTWQDKGRKPACFVNVGEHTNASNTNESLIADTQQRGSSLQLTAEVKRMDEDELLPSPTC